MTHQRVPEMMAKLPAGCSPDLEIALAEAENISPILKLRSSYNAMRIRPRWP
jgi:hypothetical protein